MASDEIYVEHKSSSLSSSGSQQLRLYSSSLFEALRSLVVEPEHSDVKFLVGDLEETVPAHKALLVTRCEYFRIMFRNGGMKESRQDIVRVPNYSPLIFRYMLGTFTTK